MNLTQTTPVLGLDIGTSHVVLARNSEPAFQYDRQLNAFVAIPFSKLAQGHFQTHVAGNQVDTIYLAEVAAGCGAAQPLVNSIRQANTARHAQELVQEADLGGFFDAICQEVVERSRQHVAGRLVVAALMFDFDGHVLGRAEAPRA